MSDIIRYDDFICKIRRFTRTSLLSETTQVAWRAWDNSAKLKANGWNQIEYDIYAVRAHAGRVAVLSSLCSEHCRKNAEPSDIIKLCHLYLSIEETITEKSKFKEDEYLPFLASLREHTVFGSIKDLESVAWITAVNFFPARLMATQWSHVVIPLNSSIRSWKLLTMLDDRLGGIVFKKLQSFLNISPRDFLRSAFALFTMASHAKPLGQLNLLSSKIDPELESNLNINIDTLCLVANKLSRDLMDFRDWHKQDVESLPRGYKKHFPNPLVETPLISMDRDISDRKHQYILPCPWHFVWAYSRYLIDRLDNVFEGDSINIRSALGYVINSYLFESFQQIIGKNIYQIDDGIKDKHADFVLWSDFGNALIIESKYSVGSKEYRSLSLQSFVANVWDRLFMAFEQCSHSAQSLSRYDSCLKSIKNSVAIVCIKDPLSAEGRDFLNFVQSANLHKMLSLDGLEIISINYLEELLLEFGVDQLYHIIKKKWDDGEGGSFLHKYIENNINSYSPSKISSLPHLEEASEQLFPNFRMGRL